MPSLIIELDPPGAPPVPFGGDTSSLVYFLSFAFALRYGAQHELSQAAALLRDKHNVDLRPLLTFADRHAEDARDRQEQERAWQSAAPLAESCRRVVEAIDANEALRELLADYPALRERIDELGRMASSAEERGARVRLTYGMD
jgi:hypothetical protein